MSRPYVFPEPGDTLETLAARLLTVVGRHIDAVARLQDAIGPTKPAEVERGARILAVMGRAMREIQLLLQPPQDDSSDDSEDDSVPLDADEFRRELAEKLESLLDAERRRASEDHRGVESEAS